VTVFEVAHQMAVLPLAALAWRRPKAPALWWLAGVFVVAWLADYGKHVGISPLLTSWVYPISQAGLVLAVLLPRRLALLALTWVVFVGIVGLLWGHGRGPDLILRAGAWGAIIAVLWPHRELGLLRTALLVYFGVGLLAWAGYTAVPGWTSWGVYQGIRAAGIGLFSWGVWHHEAR
jgi:hypothetical protein